MSPYQDALAWLFGTQFFGIKLGLENTHRLFDALSLPGPAQRILHVAGTNGKGSVCAMLDSILRAQGYRTGLFTSPHLVSFRERIRVDGVMISEGEVARGLTSIREIVHAWEPHPTFFEIATALALRHFRERQCDFVVLETGMGGRLDATNATQPVVSVITPIALDHQKWLGDTIAQIAGEKAGIIKPQIPVVSAPQSADAAAVITARAQECAAPLRFVREELDPVLPLSLAGTHQKQNATLALAALRAAQITVSADAIARGLATVAWPARFQRWDRHTIIDGAHNPAGAAVLARTWREHFPDTRASIILAVLADKDIAGICRTLAPIAARFLLPAIRSERALAPNDLAAILRETAPEIPCAIFPNLAAAIAAARRDLTPLLLTGSLHFAGEVLAHLEGRPAAFEECTQ